MSSWEHRPHGSWCFTKFGGLEEFATNCELLNAGRDAASGVRYICMQLERSPDTGRLHWQGFAKLCRTQRRSWVKRVLGDESIHLEPRLATSTDRLARDYCNKEESRAVRTDDDGTVPERLFGTFFEWGEFVERGRRTDLESLKETIDSGANVEEIAEKHFGEFLRYHKAIELYRSIGRKRNRAEQPDVRVYWGPTGAGKSRSVWSEFGQNDGADLFVVNIPDKGRQPWFDGYEGQSTALIDDYMGYEYDLGFLLKLLDRYPMRVQVKHGMVNWACNRIIFTSNIHPDNWYNEHAPASRAAFRRRITCIREFRRGGLEPHTEEMDVNDD